MFFPEVPGYLRLSFGTIGTGIGLACCLAPGVFFPEGSFFVVSVGGIFSLFLGGAGFTNGVFSTEGVADPAFETAGVVVLSFGAARVVVLSFGAAGAVAVLSFGAAGVAALSSGTFTLFLLALFSVKVVALSFGALT